MRESLPHDDFRTHYILRSCTPTGLSQREVPVKFLCLIQVYGDPLEHPQTETYWGNVNCIGERSCYDEGKRAAECLTFDYQREHGLEVITMPYSHSYSKTDCHP